MTSIRARKLEIFAMCHLTPESTYCLCSSFIRQSLYDAVAKDSDLLS